MVFSLLCLMASRSAFSNSRFCVRWCCINSFRVIYSSWGAAPPCLARCLSVMSSQPFCLSSAIVFVLAVASVFVLVPTGFLKTFWRLFLDSIEKISFLCCSISYSSLTLFNNFSCFILSSRMNLCWFFPAFSTLLCMCIPAIWPRMLIRIFVSKTLLTSERATLAYGLFLILSISYLASVSLCFWSLRSNSLFSVTAQLWSFNCLRPGGQSFLLLWAALALFGPTPSPAS